MMYSVILNSSARSALRQAKNKIFAFCSSLLQLQRSNDANLAVWPLLEKEAPMSSYGTMQTPSRSMISWQYFAS